MEPTERVEPQWTKDESRLIEEYRFRRGKRAGEAGHPPEEVTNAYLKGYVEGRGARLEEARRNR